MLIIVGRGPPLSKPKTSTDWYFGPLLDRGEGRLVAAVETGLIPVSFAIDIAHADSSEVQNVLMDAYGAGKIKGKKLAAIRRMLDQHVKRSKEVPDSGFGRKNTPHRVTKNSRKYTQIVGSIRVVGLVESPVVTPDPKQPGTYFLLDGHLRVEALKDIGIGEVDCLVSTGRGLHLQQAYQPRGGGAGAQDDRACRGKRCSGGADRGGPRP